MGATQRMASAGSSGAPWRLGWPVWSRVLKDAWRDSGEDNLGLIAAGVAFYGFLSLVPALSATLLLYGLFASPEMLGDALLSLSKHLPADAAKVVGDQIASLVAAPSAGKSWGAAMALGLAIYGATKGVDGLVTALTIAYDLQESRNWLHRTATILALTSGAVIFVVVSLAAVSALSLPAALLPVAFDTAWHLAIAGSALLLATGTLAAAALFRFAPPPPIRQFCWLSPGAMFAALGWFAVTSGFAWYAANFGNYGATWGALAGIIVLLTWLYLCAFILLLGAELNAQLDAVTRGTASSEKDK